MFGLVNIVALNTLSGRMASCSAFFFLVGGSRLSLSADRAQTIADMRDVQEEVSADASGEASPLINFVSVITKAVAADVFKESKVAIPIGKSASTVLASTKNSEECLKFENHKKSWDKQEVKPSTDAPMIAQMAALAENIYFNGDDVAGWKLVKHWDTLSDMIKHDGCTSTANVGIYTKRAKGGKRQCALVFAGTDDKNGWNQNLAKQTSEWCGIAKVHGGFKNRVSAFWDGSHSLEFMDYLKGKECGGGAIHVGHSLGGALSSLSAHCAAREKRWTVHAVYTFGAPGPAIGERIGPSGKNECFKGARVINKNSVEGKQDPYPAALYLDGFKQPRIPLLIYDGHKENVTCRLVDCLDSEAGELPRPTEKLPSHNLHLKHKYVLRAMRLADRLEEHPSDVPKMTGTGVDPCDLQHAQACGRNAGASAEEVPRFARHETKAGAVGKNGLERKLTNYKSRAQTGSKHSNARPS